MKRGITGTGQLIPNGEWMLWDDTHSPGLIGLQRFDELKELVLTNGAWVAANPYLFSDEQEARSVVMTCPLRIRWYDPLITRHRLRLELPPSTEVANRDRRLS
jgi:hypothetical protein